MRTMQLESKKIRVKSYKMFIVQQERSHDSQMVNCACLSVKFPTATGINSHPEPATTNSASSRIPRHTAGRRTVHLPRRVQVHVDRPVGGDADRLGGLHVRRRDAPSPREPSSLRHPGSGLSVSAGRSKTRSSLAPRGVFLFRVPPSPVSLKYWSPLR